MILSLTSRAGVFALIFSAFLVQLPDWAYGFTALGYLGIFGLCGMAITQEKITEFRINLFTIFGVLFFTYLSWSLFWSEIPYLSIYSLCLHAIVPFILVTQGFLKNPVMDYNKFYQFLCVVGVGLSLYALYQFFSNTGQFIGAANYPFYNPNSLAVLLGVCCLSSLHFSLKNSSCRWAYLIGCIFIVAGIVTTQSRAVILMIVITALIMIWFVYKAKQTSFKSALMTFIGVVVSVTIFPLILDFIKGDAYLVQAMSIDLSFLSTRIIIWQGVIEAALSTNPFLGNGLGTFSQIYQNFRHVDDRTMGMHAHNDILHLLVEIGLIGLSIGLMLVVGVLVATSKILSNIANHHDKILPLIIILFIGGMAMATSIVLLPCVMLILALALTHLMPLLRDRMCGGVMGAQIAIVGLILMTILSLQNASQYYLTAKIKQSLSDQNIEAFFTHIDRLDQISLRLNDVVPMMQTSLMFSLMDNHLVQDDQIQEAYSEIQLYLDDAERRNPYNIGLKLYEGELLLRQGEKAKAKLIFENGLKADPMFINLRLALIEMTDDIKEQERLLRDGFGYHYWRHDPKKLYASAIIFAVKHNKSDLHEMAQDALQVEMRLK